MPTLNHNGFRAGEKDPKKIPGLRFGRPGILPACTLHSLILEDLAMKYIQAGFLTLPTLTRLPTLRPFDKLRAQDSGFFVKALIPHLIRDRDYSGGSVPDFLRINGDHGVPSLWIPPIQLFPV